VVLLLCNYFKTISTFYIDSSEQQVLNQKFPPSTHKPLITTNSELVLLDYYPAQWRFKAAPSDENVFPLFIFSISLPHPVVCDLHTRHKV